MFSKVTPVRALIFSLTIAFSGFCMAEKVDVSDVEVVEVYINSAGLMLLKIEDVEEWLQIGQAGTPANDALYSTALAAKLANQKIWIRYWTQDEGFSTVGIISIK